MKGEGLPCDARWHGEAHDGPGASASSRRHTVGGVALGSAAWACSRQPAAAAAVALDGLLGAKWRRQQVLGRFVADFFCAELKAVIEVDGAIHRDQAEADQERQRALEASGLRVLRVRASDVEMDLHGVLDRLAESLRASPSPILGEGDSGDAQDAAGVRARGRTVKGPGGPGGQVR